MRWAFLSFGRIAAAAASVFVGGAASASTVVVNADEWAISDSGFAQAPDAGRFVSNLVNEFGPVIHAYSNNFAYTGSSLAAAMAAAGATYTTGTGFAFTLPNISSFDAVFLGGNYLSSGELGVLSNYVAGGGNVYISAGTGVGGAAAEADAWNPFLSSFGMQLSAPYTGFTGTAAVSGDPLFAGVSSLYFGNPNSLSGSSVSCCGAEELFGISRADSVAPIPLPAGGALLASALALLALRRGGRARS